MRKFIYALFFIVLVAACKKNQNAPINDLMENIDAGSTPVTPTGTFQQTPGHAVTGSARVYVKDNKYTLQLENMNITNGPDLHVYLSKEMIPINFIDLGRLKSTIGNQLYEISGTPDFTQYVYAVIHCKQYNVLFASALMK